MNLIFAVIMADWFSQSKQTSTTAVDDLPFCSRRSPVVARHGMVASSQPLASSIGLDLLRKGANAAEAAIGVAAALAVTEPCSTGLGGDMFCLHYEAATKQVTCVNGSGCSPAGLSLERLREDLPNGKGGVSEEKFQFSAHSVTVPGAARGWEDTLTRYGSGRFSFLDLLKPAIDLAEEGFPVSPITSYHWKRGIAQIGKWVDAGSPVPMTVDGLRGPNAGEIFSNPDVARVLRDLGTNGATDGFYKGDAGVAIVRAVQKNGGVLAQEDLDNHQSTFPDPISVRYRDVRLWQVPPNGQGVAGLIALSGLNALEEAGIVQKFGPRDIGRADAYHAMIEMMRLGFADGREYVCDPRYSTVTNDWLVDEKRISERALKLFDPNKATIKGTPLASSCTVSFQVVDKEGNAISFVNSNFMGFGTGIVPDGCGFTLQNRGFGFNLEEGHPNVVAPSKRPYHTIIPGLITYEDNNDLHSTISNMGGNMQPQGHLQLTVDMIAGGYDPQAAIDVPRFCIADGTKDGDVFLEEGVAKAEVSDLLARGHELKGPVHGHGRALMGRAQVIRRDRATGVLWGGSDGRADGCAMGY